MADEDTTPTGEEPEGDATTLDDIITAIAGLKEVVIAHDELIGKLIDATNTLLDSTNVTDDGGNANGNDGEEPKAEGIDLETPLEDLDFTQN